MELDGKKDTLKFDISDLKKHFISPKPENGPYIYIPVNLFDTLDIADFEDNISKLISGYKKNGFGGLIPYIDSDINEQGSVAEEDDIIEPDKELYINIFGTILKYAEKNSIKVAYMDQEIHMRRYLHELPEDISLHRRCHILQKYEFECIGGEEIKRTLYPDGELLSIVAVEADTLDTIDLREFITEDNEILWSVPNGNWSVHQYVCTPDLNSARVNLFSYDASLSYITSIFKDISDLHSEYLSDGTLDMFIYNEVQFYGKNRRMWDSSFNSAFMKMFGIDPAPYYPALYMNAGKDAERLRAMFTSCRTKLLTDGYMKAVADFTSARRIFSTGCAFEPKSVACSWISGDNMMIHKYASSPGAALSHAYLYGLNSLKVASGAATGFDREIITGELFKKYRIYGDEILYRETMNAFTRGVNLLFTHLGKDSSMNHYTTEPQAFLGFKFTVKDNLDEYCDYCARSQIILGGGRHICDIAIIYPIHYLMSQVFLYETADNRIDYPSTPEDADYMTLMNSILSYTGRDADLIHPDIIAEKCYAEDGVMHLKNETAFAQYKVVILPGMSMISLKCLRLLKKFFDEGGKIISTTRLPDKAFEFYGSADIPIPNTPAPLNQNKINAPDKETEDSSDEVKSIIRHIFGVDTDDKHTVKDYYVNRNENGGVAYFFHSTKTSSDGTGMVDGHKISEALKTFDISYDVELVGITRVEYTGILNHYLPVFEKIGIHDKLSHHGSVSYIHKKYAGCDIYYITNTTEAEYDNKVLLKGRLVPEEWNPHTGKIKKLPYEYVSYRSNIYTHVNIKLEVAAASVIISLPPKDTKETIKELVDTTQYPEIEI